MITVYDSVGIKVQMKTSELAEVVSRLSTKDKATILQWMFDDWQDSSEAAMKFAKVWEKEKKHVKALEKRYPEQKEYYEKVGKIESDREIAWKMVTLAHSNERLEEL